MFSLLSPKLIERHVKVVMHQFQLSSGVLCLVGLQCPVVDDWMRALHELGVCKAFDTAPYLPLFHRLMVIGIHSIPLGRS